MPERLPEHLEPSNDKQNAVEKQFAARRDLLKLGVAGLPMVLTLNSSAAHAAASQLTCFFNLPERVRIMVNSDGHAWASTTHNVRFSNKRQAFRKDDLDEFLLPGNSLEFTAGVPSQYIPTGCSSPPNGNWVDCGWNKFSISNNAKITPGNFLDANNNWVLTGNKGLFVALSIQYANTSTTGWPGISCIVSILTYLNSN